MSRSRPLVGLLLLVLPDMASAHSPIAGIGDFYNGMLHPLLVPAHLLALLALGLLLGQRGLPSMRLALPAFILTLIVGLAASSVTLGNSESWLLPGVICCGLLVVLQRDLPRVVCLLLAVALGALIGLDSPGDGVQGRERWLTLAGTALGGSLWLIFIAGFTDLLQQPWQRIGIRVLGSWITASALLVLALAARRLS